MKYLIGFILVALCCLGAVSLVQLTRENEQLAMEVAQLEAELGRMVIDDVDRVHIVAIEEPKIPPEVASHVEGVWQFRCYLPPGYDFVRMSGGGRVMEEGVYLSGGSSSSWGSPNKESIHELLTISLAKEDERIISFVSFGGSSGTTSWNRFNPEGLGEGLVVKSLVGVGERQRSFEQDTILPILKIYDSSTGESKVIGDRDVTTYSGGLVVLCPKSRQQECEQLQQGKVPVDFDPSWIASGVEQ